MKGKKGIELSLNFIVILIISIIIFVGGLAMTYKFFKMADTQKANLDADTDEKIDNVLADGSKVAIPFATKEIKIGHDDIFGLGILNTYRQQTHSFVVNVAYNDSYDLGGTAIPNVDRDFVDSHWTMNLTQIYTLKPNEMLKIPIYIKTASLSKDKGIVRGTYIFDVCVYQLDFGTSWSDAQPTDLHPTHCPPEPDPDPASARSHLYDGYIHQITVTVP